MSQDASPLLRMPPELRLIIYAHLLGPGGGRALHIRNKPVLAAATTRRSVYHVVEGGCSRPATYGLVGGAVVHGAILATGRRIWVEAAPLLYAQHAFHFGRDTEAAVHWLGDLSPGTRGLVRHVALHKGSPMAPLERDGCAWAAACRLVRALPALRRLRITVAGGRPRGGAWDGPRALGLSDLALLYATRHEALAWARELAGLRGLEALELAAELAAVPAPRTPAARIFAALSASIETTLVDFLQSELGLPCVVAASAGVVEEVRGSVIT